MGNYRFKFSDMIPNVWFYKLKDINSTKNHSKSQSFNKKNNNQPSISSTTTSTPRYSYIFKTEDQIKPLPNHKLYYYNSPVNLKPSDTHFPLEQPKKSSKKGSRRRRTIYRPSPKACSFHLTHESSDDDSLFGSISFENDGCDTGLSDSGYEEFGHTPSSHRQHHHHAAHAFNQTPSLHDSYGSQADSPENDIIIDMDDHCTKKFKQHADSELENPPILVKKTEEITRFRRRTGAKFENPRILKEDPDGDFIGRKSFTGSAGIKIRANSPRVTRKKKKMNQSRDTARKSVLSSSSSKSLKNSKTITESFAIVKSSVDPEKDFRDSMMEMIVENKIQASNDLEELLACYLMLNSKEYHEIIIKVFEKIWFEIISNLNL